MLIHHLHAILFHHVILPCRMAWYFWCNWLVYKDAPNLKIHSFETFCLSRLLRRKWVQLFHNNRRNRKIFIFGQKGSLGIMSDNLGSVISGSLYYKKASQQKQSITRVGNNKSLCFCCCCCRCCQGCQIFLSTKYQNGKNIPNYDELYQMSIKCNKRP
jgi:hypothetical protein